MYAGSVFWPFDLDEETGLKFAVVGGTIVLLVNFLVAFVLRTRPGPP